jgi:hypothetical protein
MSKYVVISGTSPSGQKGSLHFAKSDISYNLRLAARKHDKDTYVRMLRLKKYVSYGIRMQDTLGNPCITLKLESWKNGQKYVVRNMNGKFLAVVDK